MNKDPKDPMHKLMHGLVETCLKNIAQGKSKDRFGALNKKSSWIDYKVKK